MAGRQVDELLDAPGRGSLGTAPDRIEMVGIRGDGEHFPVEVSMGVLCRSSGVRIATCAT